MAPGQQSDICNPLPLTPGWQRVALLLEYNGTTFYGSQFQPDRRTIQGSVVQAIKALGVTPHSMALAGRTDAGVHAKGQVVHFDLAPDALKSIQDFRLALHRRLPPEIAVRDIRMGISPAFHSQRSAAYKWYRYKMYLGHHRSVWMPTDAAFPKIPADRLDIDRMNTAARLIEGKHCFKSFQCTGTDLQNDVCAIMRARFRLEQGETEDYSGNLLVFDIVGDRFLYKMVRSLVGQFLEIGQADASRFPHAQDPGYILEVLARQDRSQAAYAAAANGLSLMSVVYPEALDYFREDPNRRRLAALLYETEPASKVPVHSNSHSEASTNQDDEYRIFNETQMERKQNEDLFCKAS